MGPIDMFYKHKNKIAFRKLRPNDLPELLELKNESWFGTVNFACLNLENQLKWFEGINSRKDCLYLIAHPEFGTEPSIGLYGITDINPVNRTCAFTHSLYAEARGKGHGKTTLQAGIDFTFEVLNMRRIDTWILENNVAELKTSQSVGFQIEGTARKAVYKCGQYLDCHYLGLLRDEWEASERVQSYGGVCNTTYQPKDGTNGTS